jgi:hypothetical protein
MINKHFAVLHGCATRQTQPATIDPKSATTRATEAQPTLLKATALKPIESNPMCNQTTAASAKGRNPGANIISNRVGAEKAISQAIQEWTAILEHECSLACEMAEAAADLFKAFYGRLIGEGKPMKCCYVSAGLHCPEGRRLRDIYYGVCS